MKLLGDHIKEQATLGKKFIYRQQPPAGGNEYELYINATINADNTFYYSSKEQDGLYLAHNHLNYLHTTNPTYISESKSILDKQLANSSIISKVNESQRNAFFYQLEKHIDRARMRIQLELEA